MTYCNGIFALCPRFIAHILSYLALSRLNAQRKWRYIARVVCWLNLKTTATHELTYYGIVYFITGLSYRRKWTKRLIHKYRISVHSNIHKAAHIKREPELLHSLTEFPRTVKVQASVGERSESERDTTNSIIWHDHDLREGRGSKRFPMVRRFQFLLYWFSQSSFSATVQAVDSHAVWCL